jgi:hypothetical protein
VRIGELGYDSSHVEVGGNHILRRGGNNRGKHLTHQPCKREDLRSQYLEKGEMGYDSSHVEVGDNHILRGKKEGIKISFS